MPDQTNIPVAAAEQAKSDPYILEIEDFRLWYAVYNRYAQVLNGVNLNVRPGEKVGLVGEAGCGKTTAMKAVLRVLPEKSFIVPGGRILFRGRDIYQMNAKELHEVRSAGISMISQEPHAALNPVFTIGQQMLDVVKFSEEGQGRSNKEQKEMALQAIREVMIPDAERIFNFYPNQLSGGMKQRICIAMAIVTHRQLMIADEPGTALDVTVQDQIHNILNGLVEERNVALIMITHSLGVARELTDRINVMYAGSVVESAVTADVFNNPLHPYTIGLLEAVPHLSGGGVSAGIYGSLPDYINPPRGCRFCDRCQFAMDICREAAPPMVDAGNGHQVACFKIQGGAS